jgi:hypothetical protein
VAVGVGLVVVGVLGAGWASAGPAVQLQAEDSTSTTESSGSTTDENPLLVPGPAPEGVVSQDEGDEAEAEAEDVSTAVAQDDPNGGSSNDEAEDTVRMVMFALIGVAIALALLTVYYWWRTRPARPGSEPRRRRGGALDDQGDSSSGSPVGEEPNEGNPTTRRSSRPDDGDAGTVGAWQTDSTSTR